MHTTNYLNNGCQVISELLILYDKDVDYMKAQNMRKY